jgi:hypothetical protein
MSKVCPLATTVAVWSLTWCYRCYEVPGPYTDEQGRHCISCAPEPFVIRTIPVSTRHLYWTCGERNWRCFNVTCILALWVLRQIELFVYWIILPNYFHLWLIYECLRWLAGWDFGFESRCRIGCLSLVRVVVCERSLRWVDPSSRGVMPSLVYVIECDQGQQ